MHQGEGIKKLDIRSCSEESLETICREHSIAGFRARQIFTGVHRHGAASWDEIPSLGADARDMLRNVLVFDGVEIVREKHSRDTTAKYLVSLADGERVETVLIPDAATGRRTICLSTQVGCPVGCTFCSTGQEGFRRDLSAGEIVGQVLEVIRAGRMGDTGFKINNVVFMGMGEPFLNTTEVMEAVELLNAERGLNIGRRKMTISTCGVVPGIRLLAERRDQIGLAVSLHSCFDETRDRLVPMNKKYPLAELMKACREYCAATHRRVTFEMVLTRETCTDREAYALIKLLAGMISHVNLIPVNPTLEGSERPEKERVSRFLALLMKARIPASLREEKGVDIEAACGQLRRVAACEGPAGI
ncbi:MAG: 23S rRNA (adenine(2503)-C(2))-methyltransferase RlmN [Peptococcaceae bacterium]|nr:23S rRNA (adenine(2503)-C(2))-methyltransferase RlmN [Peptococcaceae bacterium]